MKRPLIWGSALTLSFLLAANAVALRASDTRKNDDSSKASHASTMALDSLDGLDVQAFRGNAPGAAVKVKADVATYQGRRAVHIVNDDSAVAKGSLAGGQSLAIVKESDFKDGVIEVEVVGLPRPGAPPDTRGFVGVAFRVQDHASKFEAFYLRFTNGRADDQLRRNHAAQYVSEPNFSWYRLRDENPGVYESYVDIEPKAWTKIKVVVTGTKARLYVNGADQPCLIVNDLKLGETHGPVALWNGSDTEAYFSHLRIE